ncbi:MAG: hypothetical protein Q8M83_03310 [bacterium]|nr:hypothetical protein [bacterium]
MKKKMVLFAVVLVAALATLAPVAPLTGGPDKEQKNELQRLIETDQITWAELETFLQQNRPKPPKRPLIPEGWEVVEDVTPTQFQIADLEFVSFLKKGESYISGKEMRSRAIKLKANLGLRDTRYLLEHQDEIPAGLRDKYLVFPGTVLRRRPFGDLFVTCLCWVGDRWVQDWHWVGHDFGGYYVLPRGK